MVIGDTEFEITQIGKECHQKCAIFHQVGDCVMPREGIFARVIMGGVIRAGDEIICMGTHRKGREQETKTVK